MFNNFISLIVLVKLTTNTAYMQMRRGAMEQNYRLVIATSDIHYSGHTWFPRTKPEDAHFIQLNNLVYQSSLICT